jgi:hypothetical protein
MGASVKTTDAGIIEEGYRKVKGIKRQGPV